MIRRATDDDTAAVIPLIGKAHVAKGLDRLWTFNPAFMVRRWRSYLASSDSLCLVHEVGGHARGVFVGMAVPYADGPIKVAIERVSWIDPEYRGMAWFRMLREFEAWAIAKGCRCVAQTGKDDPRFADALGRRGYSPYETHFLKEL